jgi:hypothetical protein
VCMCVLNEVRGWARVCIGIYLFCRQRSMLYGVLPMQEINTHTHTLSLSSPSLASSPCRNSCVCVKSGTHTHTHQYQAVLKLNCTGLPVAMISELNRRLLNVLGRALSPSPSLPLTLALSRPPLSQPRSTPYMPRGRPKRGRNSSLLLSPSSHLLTPPL